MDVDSSEDEKNMGVPGGSYTDSDFRLFAKFIASQDEEVTATVLTTAFSERVSLPILRSSL